MSKEEFLEEILSLKHEVVIKGNEHYDFPNYEEVVPVWWVEKVFGEVFKDKDEDDNKHYEGSLENK